MRGVDALKGNRSNASPSSVLFNNELEASVALIPAWLKAQGFLIKPLSDQHKFKCTKQHTQAVHSTANNSAVPEASTAEP